ncbi:putative glucose-6-phosphate 1-epimerase isoform X3 [Prosopis cineraria]|uniref:putative glucose-6-phosphate 1-epimerase isoform X3 n=1 Tax=Prosopis cineraria TaxID=364024 RepID=UPI00240EFE25|nr:putative glucose-6-phosphate 1-epimerase isoform X3 [Prosopis cineraria]
MASRRSFSENFEAFLRRCIYMEVKLHPGRMNLGKSCSLLVVRQFLSPQKLYVEVFQFVSLKKRLWTVDPDPPPLSTANTSRAFIDLILKNSEEDAKIWPHRYEFRLRISLGPQGDLMLTSRIRNTNTDGKPFSFTFAYLTHLQVTDISEVRVEGLETIDYLDNLQNRQRFTEQGDALTFESEVDRVYLRTPTKIAVIDHERKRTYVVKKDGLPDAVVWNPWDKKSKAMPDLGDKDYLRMICVQAACVEKPITLKPGEEWKGRQQITAVRSSYCSGQLDPQRYFSMAIRTE